MKLLFLSMVEFSVQMYETNYAKENDGQLSNKWIVISSIIA